MEIELHDQQDEDDPFDRAGSVMLAHSQKEITRICELAGKIPPIRNAEQYQVAVDLGRVLQTAASDVKEFYRPIKQGIDERKQEVLKRERADLEPLLSAKDRLGRVIQEYDDRQKAEAIYLDRQAEAANPALDDQLLPPPVITQMAVVGKTRGKVTRSKWHGVVEDFRVLVDAVAERKAPLMALLPNQPYLDKRADADRETMSIPGVRVEEERKVHFRS